MTFSGFDPGLYRKVSAFVLAPEASNNVTTILLEIRLYLRLVITLSQGSSTFTREALVGGAVSRMTASFPSPEKLVLSGETAPKVAAAARLAKQLTELAAIVKRSHFGIEYLSLGREPRSMKPNRPVRNLEREATLLQLAKDFIQKLGDTKSTEAILSHLLKVVKDACWSPNCSRNFAAAGLLDPLISFFEASLEATLPTSKRSSQQATDLRFPVILLDLLSTLLQSFGSLLRSTRFEVPFAEGLAELGPRMLPWVKKNLERLEENDWCNALQLVFAYFELHPGQKWASRFVLLDVAMKSADRTYSPRSEDLV
jgi:hypothetical protein